MTDFFAGHEPTAGPAGPTLDQIVEAVISKLAGDPAAIARAHQAADVDAGPQAMHHTLGGSSGQSAAGNHLHDGRYVTSPSTVAKQEDHPRTWFTSTTLANSSIVLATAETKDSLGDITFEMINFRDYTFIYVARFSAVTAVISMDARVRITRGTPPGSVTNTDDLAATASVPIDNLTGSGADSRTVLGHQRCPNDFLPGDYRAAAFFDVTSGAGTLTVDQPGGTGSRRSLIVIESPSAA
jgi:hypothetical protein